MSGWYPKESADTMALASGCTKWAIFTIFTRTSYQSLAEIFQWQRLVLGNSQQFPCLPNGNLQQILLTMGLFAINVVLFVVDPILFFVFLGTKKCYEPLVVLIDFFDLTPPYHLVGESGRQLALCHISDEVDFVSRKTWGTTHHFLGIPQNFYHHGSRSRSGHQIRRSVEIFPISFSCPKTPGSMEVSGEVTGLQHGRGVAGSLAPQR